MGDEKDIAGMVIENEEEAVVTEKQPVEETEEVVEESAEEKKETEEKEKEEPKKRENHDQRRWRRLIQERAELRAENDYLKRSLSENQEPVNREPTRPARKDYDDSDAFQEAMTDYNEYLVEKASRQPAREDADPGRGWRTKEAKAIEKYDDYEELVYDGEQLRLSAPVIDAIISSDVGADVRYLLAKEPELLDQIENVPPAQAIRAIGRIEARILRDSAKKAKPTENKPKPVSPEKGAKGANKGDLSTDVLFQKFSKGEPVT